MVVDKCITFMRSQGANPDDATGIRDRESKREKGKEG